MSRIAGLFSAAGQIKTKAVRRTSRLFAQSITLSVADKIRSGFLTLSLNVCGMFFLTYGIYTVISAVLLHYFASSFAGNISLFSGVAMAACAVPMLFSKDNITGALASSNIGRDLCKYIGVRMVSMVQEKKTGHLNQGFALGVVAGTLSIVLSTEGVLWAMLISLVCAVCFALPATGVMFCAAVLPFSHDRLLALVSIVTVLAFFVKLLRGKRTVTFHISGTVFCIFHLMFTLHILFGKDCTVLTSWKYVIFVSSYFLFCFILNSCRSCVRTMIVASVACGALSAAYCVGYGTFALLSELPSGFSVDASYILDFVTELHLFSDGSAHVLICAAVPLTVGMALRRDHRVPRWLLWFSAIADIAFLLLTDSVAYLAFSVFALIVLLLIYGKKYVYFALGALSIFSAVASFAFPSVGNVLSALPHAVFEYTAGTHRFFASLSDLSGGELILGSSLFAGSGENFYSHMIISFGLIVFLCFIAFLATTLFLSVRFLIKTVGIDKKRDTFNRFDSVRCAADTRLGCIAPLLSATVLLVCGSTTDLFSCGVLFMLLWMLLGICASYRRNALKEMAKAEAAESFTATRRSAEAMIRF